ncbi:MAG: heme-binding domain-containing protein [Terracidiphilus sp.]|jgi:cytochrome c
MSRGRAVLFCFLGALAASLLLARVHPFGDAGLYAARGPAVTLPGDGKIPDAVRDLLAEKCADCHSNQTRAPFYGRFAPVSWLMERDILKGRAAMNLARWDSYSAAQQQTFAAKIAQQTRAHEMPLLQYRMIHWNARITDGDIHTLSSWARTTSGAESSAAGEGASERDPERGKALFEKRCTGCHALTQNHEGPRLQGVYGRAAGSAAGFAYSAALKKAGIVWDDGSLDKWLTDPDAFIAGNDMDFLVSKPQERRDLIGYLKQVSGR